MIELKSNRDVAAFSACVTGVSITASFGTTLVLGQALEVPISPIGYNISWVIPLIVAAPVSYAIGNALRQVTSLKDRIERGSRTDALTGTLNRKGVFDRFNSLSPAQSPISVVMIDVDRFKAINDTHGHAAGDETLRLLADLLMRHLPADQGFVGRLGGEEFLAVLFCPLRQAAATAEQLRRLVASSRVSVGTTSIAMSASFGVTCWRTDEQIDMALIRADRAMYEAKTAGRNRVVIDPTLATLQSSPAHSAGVRSVHRSTREASAEVRRRSSRVR